MDIWTHAGGRHFILEAIPIQGGSELIPFILLTCMHADDKFQSRTQRSFSKIQISDLRNRALSDHLAETLCTKLNTASGCRYEKC